MEITEYLQKKGSVELEDIAKETSQNKAQKEKHLGSVRKGTEQSFGDLWDNFKWSV